MPGTPHISHSHIQTQLLKALQDVGDEEVEWKTFVSDSKNTKLLESIGIEINNFEDNVDETVRVAELQEKVDERLEV